MPTTSHYEKKKKKNAPHRQPTQLSSCGYPLKGNFKKQGGAFTETTDVVTSDVGNQEWSGDLLGSDDGSRDLYDFMH